MIATTFLTDFTRFFPRTTPQIFFGFLRQWFFYSHHICHTFAFIHFLNRFLFFFPSFFTLIFNKKKSLRSTRHLFHIPIPLFCSCRFHLNEAVGAIHSTKISGNFGLKLNGSVRSNRKSFEKTGPPFEVVLFSPSDRSECWLNGSRPVFHNTHVITYVFDLRSLGSALVCCSVQN